MLAYSGYLLRTLYKQLLGCLSSLLTFAAYNRQNSLLSEIDKSAVIPIKQTTSLYYK